MARGCCRLFLDRFGRFRQACGATVTAYRLANRPWPYMTRAMPDATHHSRLQDAVLAPAPISEDRRRPKAIAPYAGLWGATVLCVVFALLAMFLQR